MQQKHQKQTDKRCCTFLDEVQVADGRCTEKNYKAKKCIKIKLSNYQELGLNLN